MKAFIADWRNPSLYPPVQCEDKLRLAWELLRRTELYAEHAAQMKLLQSGEFESGFSTTSDSSLAGQNCSPIAHKGETARMYFERLKGNKSARIAKPFKTFQNRWSISYPVAVTEEYSDDVVFTPKFVGTAYGKDLAGRKFSLFLFPNEVAVRFRRDLPFASQLSDAQKFFDKAVLHFNAASNLAEDHDQASQDKPKKQRKRGTVYDSGHFWLRALDAIRSKHRDLLDSKKRLAFSSGDAEVIEHLNKEERERGGVAYVQRGKLSSWQQSVEDYVRLEKYKQLL